MKVIKTLAVLLALACVQTSYAQMGEKVSFGVRVGMAQNSFSCSDEREWLGDVSEKWDVSSKSSWNYNVGLVVDIPVVKKWNFSIQTGLWFTEKKGSVEGSYALYTDPGKYGFSGSYTTTSIRKHELSVMFLSLPLLMTYHYNFGDIRAEVNFGPYLEYGIGKGESKYEYGTKTSGTFEGDDVSKDYSPSVTEADFFGEDASHFGYGLSFGIGAYWKKIYLGAKYDLGLNDYFKDYDVDYSLKSRMLSICVGYNF